MKIAVAQINPTVGDCAGNAHTICQQIDEARRTGAELVVFPELAIPGYPPRDLLERPSFIAQNLRALDRVMRAAHGIAVVVGYVAHNPAPTGRALLNAAAFLENGVLIHSQAKTLLPMYDVFDEQRYFASATSSQVIPFHGQRIGLSICEDGWAQYVDACGRPLYAQDPMEQLAVAGADFVINISASPFALGKTAIRRRLGQQTVRRFSFPLLYVNMVGGNDQLVFDGGSFLLNPRGEVVWSMPQFLATQALVDTDVLHAPTTAEHSLTMVDEVAQALMMGLRDYMRKCGFTMALIGLSGGVDSAVVAALAVEALGADAVTGIAMPSPFSSRESVEDAAQLAKNLGMPFRVIPITGIYDAFCAEVGHGASRTEPDLAEENLQARVRGTILMTLSNRTGALLLSTGNKSELAVGYCTLYGDMAGGLALISDVPKTLVYALARWLNRNGEIIPARTIAKPPSAELRPHQTDAESLPDYAVLDPILKLYIEEHHGIDAIIAAGFDTAIVRDIIRRVDLNEYKRRQAPPGIQISDKAFGIGRRLPIAARLNA